MDHLDQKDSLDLEVIQGPLECQVHEDLMEYAVLVLDPLVQGYRGIKELKALE